MTSPFDPNRDERWPTPLEQADVAQVLRDMNHPDAPPLDPVRARLGPNFTPTPFGWDLQEITVGDQGEQAVLVTLSTVCGQHAVVMKPGEAAEFGKALVRYGGGLTVVDGA